MEIIPNWHPIFVHFTVALLSVATLLILGAHVVGSESIREQLRLVARWNIWIGAVFVVLTVLSGVFAYNTVNHDTPSHLAMTDHRNWALVTSVLFLVIAIWLWKSASAGRAIGGLFLVTLVVATGLLSLTAWKGGELVYRYGLGVMSLPRADTHGHADGEKHDHGTAMEDEHNNSDGHHDENNTGGHPHDNSDGHHDNPPTETNTSTHQPTSKAKDDHYADGHTH